MSSLEHLQSYLELRASIPDKAFLRLRGIQEFFSEKIQVLKNSGFVGPSENEDIEQASLDL